MFEVIENKLLGMNTTRLVKIILAAVSSMDASEQIEFIANQ